MQRRTTLLTLGALLVARPAFALYDARPDPALALAAGAWKGTLAYRDYQPPNKQVTLPTRLDVALMAPRQLALFYVFDDGPGKTVYSYEQMAFDFEARTVAWVSGGSPPEREDHTIASVETAHGATVIVMTRTQEGKRQRHVLELSPNALVLSKFEPDADGGQLQRNRYEFARIGA